jgi:hypothetical protein
LVTDIPPFSYPPLEEGSHCPTGCRRPAPHHVILIANRRDEELQRLVPGQHVRDQFQRVAALQRESQAVEPHTNRLWRGLDAGVDPESLIGKVADQFQGGAW